MQNLETSSKRNRKTKLNRRLGPAVCLAICYFGLHGQMGTAAPQEAHPVVAAKFETNTQKALPERKRSYSPASFLAQPGLQCTIYPTGGNPSVSVKVTADSDGFVRFHAVRPASEDDTKELTANCKTAAGAESTYHLDLTAADTFAPRSIRLSS